MTKIVDRIPTRPADELRAILQDVARGNTHAHGVKFLAPGEAIVIDGFTNEPAEYLDAYWVSGVQGDISLAADEVAAVAASLDIAAQDLVASQDRIDDAEAVLAEADRRAAASDAEMVEVSRMLGDHTVLLTEAQEEQAQALADGLGSMDRRLVEAQEDIDVVDEGLEQTRIRLGETEDQLTALFPRVSATEGALTESSAKADAAGAKAAEALTAAQQAYEYAQGLDPGDDGDSYAAAMEAAQKAARDALAAATKADQALTSANGKSSVRRATTDPQGMGTAVGDIWWRYTSLTGGVVIGQWTWDGSAWRSQTFSHQVIGSMDLGKATVGELDGMRIRAGTLLTNRFAVGLGTNALPDPAFGNGTITAQRLAGSVGTWSLVTSTYGPALQSNTTTDAVTARMTPVGSVTAIPTQPGQRWRVEIPADPGGGRARVNVRWWRADGTSQYVAGGSFFDGNGRTLISAELLTPEATTSESPVVGMNIDVHGTTESARSLTVYGGGTIREMTSSVLIEDGAVAARHVKAEEVAAALGSFIKVRAVNVEVTGDLSAEVARLMSAETKKLVVTESAVLQHMSAVSAEVLGTFKANRIQANDILVPGSVNAATITVTGALAANIFTAVTTTAATSFVRDRLVVGAAFEVLGAAIVNDLNVRGTLRGRDAILTGTVDVAQLNVTEAMTAELARFMTTQTRDLIVTGDAKITRATFIEGLVTPKVQALRGEFDQLLTNKASVSDLSAQRASIDQVLAQKASIGDLAAGNIVLSGTFRSGAVGGASVVIPKPYTTGAGLDQIGVWLTHNGEAPSQGADYGAAAGLWIDQAALNSPNAPNVMWIRGRNGGGVTAQGDLEATGQLRTDVLRPRRTNTNMFFDVGGRSTFAGTIQAPAVDNPDGLEVRGKNLTMVALAGSGVSQWRNIFGPIEVTTNSTLTATGRNGLVLRTDGNIAFRNVNGTPYNQGFQSGTIVALGINTGNGRVERLNNSSERYKTDIQTADVDDSFLDLRVVTYQPIGTAAIVNDVHRRWAAGEQWPLTYEEDWSIRHAEDRIYGRIAEEAYENPATRDQVGMDWKDQRPDSYDYFRDGVKLIPIVRRQRDRIRALEERLAAIEERLGLAG